MPKILLSWNARLKLYQIVIGIIVLNVLIPTFWFIGFRTSKEAITTGVIPQNSICYLNEQLIIDQFQYKYLTYRQKSDTVGELIVTKNITNYIQTNAKRVEYINNNVLLLDNIYLDSGNIFHAAETLLTVMPQVEKLTNVSVLYFSKSREFSPNGSIELFLRGIFENPDFQMLYFPSLTRKDTALCMDKVHLVHRTQEFFETYDHFQRFHQRIYDHCGVSPDTITSNEVLLYQRNKNRKLLHIDSIKENLQKELPNHQVKIVEYDNTIESCDLLRTFSKASILVTVHGFQLTNLLLLPKNATVVEIFPPLYHKMGYKNLSQQSKLPYVDHVSKDGWNSFFLSFIWSKTESCMKSYTCRYVARHVEVEVDEHQLIETIKKHAIL